MGLCTFHRVTPEKNRSDDKSFGGRTWLPKVACYRAEAWTIVQEFRFGRGVRRRFHQRIRILHFASHEENRKSPGKRRILPHAPLVVVLCEVNVLCDRNGRLNAETAFAEEGMDEPEGLDVAALHPTLNIAEGNDVSLRGPLRVCRCIPELTQDFL